MQTFGIDIGFGFTKVTNGHDWRVFKSVIGEASDVQFHEDLIHGKEDRPTSLHIITENKAWFVGELAERQSTVRSATLDQNQLMSRYAKTLALTAIANLNPDGESLRVVTGLPISYYRRHKDELTEILLGKHDVTLVDAHNKHTDVSFNIEKLRVIPQPFGSAFNMMLNDVGKVHDPRFLEEKVGIVDIGFRTADYSVCDRTHYSERGSRTTEAGIAQAFKIIAHALQEKSGVHVELFRLYEAVEKGSIKIRGKTYGLKRITEQAFSQLAGQIASDVNTLWADDWDIDHIIVTGGGGAALLPYLQPLLEGEIIPMDSHEDPRLHNVQGYQKYAVHLWDKAGSST